MDMITSGIDGVRVFLVRRRRRVQSMNFTHSIILYILSSIIKKTLHYRCSDTRGPRLCIPLLRLMPSGLWFLHWQLGLLLARHLTSLTVGQKKYDLNVVSNVSSTLSTMPRPALERDQILLGVIMNAHNAHITVLHCTANLCDGDVVCKLLIG